MPNLIIWILKISRLFLRIFDMSEFSIFLDTRPDVRFSPIIQQMLADAEAAWENRGKQTDALWI